MKVRLLGPWPFDMQAPSQSARRMLADFAAYLAGDETMILPRPSDGTAAGCYLIVTEEDMGLIGFWVVLSPRYLDEGAGQSLTAPYAEAFLEAATEEIWWERLGVVSPSAHRWRPPIVLVWPPSLADRSLFPAPGVPIERVEADTDEITDPARSGAQWLDIGGGARRQGPAHARDQDLGDWPLLPAARSIMCVIRGDLQRVSSRHQGKFGLVFVSDPPERLPEGEPLESWIARAATEDRPLPETHQMGHPVRLPGDRAAFPISGWLSRDLVPHPPRPDDAEGGALVPRDVRSRVWAQLGSATSITLMVLTAVMLLSGFIHWAAKPRFDNAPAVVDAAPQPAMSICSADHQGFVEEFRCQVRLLADNEPLRVDGCVQSAADLVKDDLFPAYCGIRDRELDKTFVALGKRSAEMAAAQACHHVLGRPYTHSDPAGYARPEAFLEDPDSRVNDLAELTATLDTACDDFRSRLESRVSGAVLSAHVGGRAGEAKEMQTLLASRATSGMSRVAKGCFEAGRRGGVGEATKYGDLCGSTVQEGIATRPGPVREAVKLSLDGTPDPEHEFAIERYGRARFFSSAPSDPVWKCHARLLRGDGSSPIPARWGMVVVGPRSYEDRQVGSQLALDALLLSMREDEVNAGSCWEAVDRMLGSYVPVHPLVEPLVPLSWPSEEQQLCGQTCAVRYRLADATRGSDWVTRETDVKSCVSVDPMPPEAERDLLTQRFEQLRLPWNNGPGRHWVEPTDEQVCAFNLVAQERLAGVLPPGLAGPLWAGELVRGVAGGTDGAAFRGATALSTYGRSRSSTNCGNAAVQCFTGELLEVLKDNRNYPHVWRDRWTERVTAVPSWEKQVLVERPWCRVVAPYMSADGRLPEGQFDYPCALGIDETRRRFEASIIAMASGITGGAR